MPPRNGIKYAKRISQECCNIVKNFCENPTNISISQNTNSLDYFTLVGGLESYAHSKSENSFKIVHFFKNYWIHFSLKFCLDNISTKNISYDLVGVNIKIFKDPEEEKEKELLFRAEWDKEIINNHAQPHWHIEPEKTFFIQKETDFDSFIKLNSEAEDLFNSNQNKVAPRKLDITKFHFAMASEWHTGNKHYQDLDEHSLKKWLNGFLEYVVSQLEYCS
jgi:hypothetical protein